MRLLVEDRLVRIRIITIQRCLPAVWKLLDQTIEQITWLRDLVQKIKDQYLGVENTIQRNSIYLLNVKNIFNVGAQVPNGGPDDRTLYYLDVEVSVNPWVLNSYDVDLK